MKNVSDSLDELLGMMDRLDKKLDEIIERNSPPEDVVELFEKIKEENVEEEIEGDDVKAKEIWK